MSDSDRWVDITTFGSAYEEQVNVSTGEFRHRRMTTHLVDHRGFRVLVDNTGLETWRSGRAPSE